MKDLGCRCREWWTRMNTVMAGGSRADVAPWSGGDDDHANSLVVLSWVEMVAAIILVKSFWVNLWCGVKLVLPWYSQNWWSFYWLHQLTAEIGSAFGWRWGDGLMIFCDRELVFVDAFMYMFSSSLSRVLYDDVSTLLLYMWLVQFFIFRVNRIVWCLPFWVLPWYSQRDLVFSLFFEKKREWWSCG